MKNDDFGDRMKSYEAVEAQRKLMPTLPVVIRLDGKGFSKFTKGLGRPYDKRLSKVMELTTIKLVEEFNCCIGYTQSDEISLIMYSDNYKKELHFGGRVQKLVGDMAVCCSLWFNKLLEEYLPEKAGKMARFDCRVFNVPSMTEASNAILWREMDATKNSVSMSASHYYSHNLLQHKNSKDKKDMLMDKGVNWNNYPSFFKRGTFIQSRRELTKYSESDIEKLPMKHEARTNPDLMVDRRVVSTVDMPPFSKVINRNDVIFNGHIPKIANQVEV